jgi:hypothetical protein
MLLSLDNLQREKEAYKALSHEDRCSRYINEDVRLEMAVQLGDLRDGESIHYMTEGRWNLHDLLVYCIRQTGPADVYICMYAIKEYQAGLIGTMKKQQSIRQVHALLDYRSGVQHADALQILKVNTDSLGMIRTHAKLIVIRNEKWGVVLTGSANLTANTRCDAGVITCDKTIADYRIEYIKRKINESNK